jgi:hypothetical protein
MHRDGSGNRIPDIGAARAEWFDANRTKSTFCSKAEWDAWQDDTGELVHKTDDGTEIRQKATLKATCRGGSRKIVHCCVIVGNPAEYAKWLAESDAALAEARKTNPHAIKSGWMAEWTYYPASYLPTLLARYGKTD